MKTSWRSLGGRSLRRSSSEGRKKPPDPSATGDTMMRGPIAPEQKGCPCGSRRSAPPAATYEGVSAPRPIPRKSAAVPREVRRDGRGASGRRHSGLFIPGSGIPLDPRGRRFVTRLHAERQPASVRAVDELDQEIGGAAGERRQRAAVPLAEQLAGELLRGDAAE